MSSEPKTKLVLLNALPISAFPTDEVTLRIRRISFEELEKIAATATVESYIRHPATVELISRYVPNITSSAALYTWKPGDVIVTVTLRTPQRGTEITELKKEDLDLRIVEVLS